MKDKRDQNPKENKPRYESIEIELSLNCHWENNFTKGKQTFKENICWLIDGVTFRILNITYLGDECIFIYF